MSPWSRRDVLRRGAVTAAAVPAAALAGKPVVAAATAADRAGGSDLDQWELAAADQPMLFAIHDAARGQVAVYHGRSEVVVTDPALVSRIVRAARTGR